MRQCDCGGRLQPAFGVRTEDDGRRIPVIDPRKMVCEACRKMVDVWPPDNPFVVVPTVERLM